MKISIQDFVDNYDILEYFTIEATKVKYNESTIEERVKEEIEHAFRTGDINVNELTDNIVDTMTEYLEDLDIDARIVPGEFANHDTIDIEEDK